VDPHGWRASEAIHHAAKVEHPYLAGSPWHLCAAHGGDVAGHDVRKPACKPRYLRRDVLVVDDDALSAQPDDLVEGLAVDGARDTISVATLARPLRLPYQCFARPSRTGASP